MRLFATAGLAALALTMIAAAPLPPYKGPVADQADILSDAAEAKLTGELKALQDRTGRQFVVVTIASLDDEPIEDLASRLMTDWRVGPDGRGAIFVVAPNDQYARISVGCRLEEIVTDAFAGKVLDEDGVPRYEKDDMEGGTVAVAEALIQQLGRPDAEAKALALKAGPANAPRTPEEIAACGE